MLSILPHHVCNLEVSDFIFDETCCFECGIEKCYVNLVLQAQAFDWYLMLTNIADRINHLCIFIPFALYASIMSVALQHRLS